MPILVQMQAPHKCGLPPVRDYYTGTLWHCDQCGLVYKLKSGDFSNYWDSFSSRKSKKLLTQHGTAVTRQPHPLADK